MKLENYNFYIADLDTYFYYDGTLTGKWFNVEEIVLKGLRAIEEEEKYNKFIICNNDLPFIITEISHSSFIEFCFKLVAINDSGIDEVIHDEMDEFLSEFIKLKKISKLYKINEELELLLTGYYKVKYLGKHSGTPEEALVEKYIQELNINIDSESKLLKYLDYENLGLDLSSNGICIKDSKDNCYLIKK